MYKTILAALDGSAPSLHGADLALEIAKTHQSAILAVHVYGARLHRERFGDMEPGLNAEYQDQELLQNLRLGHDGLISDGLKALSQGYLDRFVMKAQNMGVRVRTLNLEGRNYVELIKAAREHGADLITLGAQGLGDIGNGRMGSTAARVMRRADCDVLIARKALGSGAVALGIDGSPEALQALKQAQAWSQALEAPLTLLAAYDREFHQQVFKAMAGTLSPEQLGRTGLDRQEELHRQIIDDGLGALYQSFLDQAMSQAGAQATSELLVGKAYDALVGRMASGGLDLLVMARHGHHREDLEPMGSNAEAVAQLAPGNVLIARVDRGAPQARGLEWSPAAQAGLERIPAGPRQMARRAVEDYVSSQSRNLVEEADLRTVASRFGMGS